MSEKIAFELYYDYLCPYAHAASVWARQLTETLGDQVDITWRAFPLEQVNSTEGPHWKLWEHPNDGLSQGLLAFRAGKAAARQGKEPFERFHHALMDLRHVTRRNLTRRATMVQLARETGLDLEQFERDLDDPALLHQIGADYELGRTQHSVFGTPTIVFPDGEALYLQMNPPPLDDSVALLRDLIRMASNQPYVVEIKRPA